MSRRASPRKPIPGFLGKLLVYPFSEYMHFSRVLGGTGVLLRGLFPSLILGRHKENTPGKKLQQVAGVWEWPSSGVLYSCFCKLQNSDQSLSIRTTPAWQRNTISFIV